MKMSETLKLSGNMREIKYVSSHHPFCYLVINYDNNEILSGFIYKNDAQLFINEMLTTNPLGHFYAVRNGEWLLPWTPKTKPRISGALSYGARNVECRRRIRVSVGKVTRPAYLFFTSANNPIASAINSPVRTTGQFVSPGSPYGDIVTGLLLKPELIVMLGFNTDKNGFGSVAGSSGRLIVMSGNHAVRTVMRSTSATTTP
jgi:hypothetical protein